MSHTDLMSSDEQQYQKLELKMTSQESLRLIEQGQEKKKQKLNRQQHCCYVSIVKAVLNLFH